MADPVDAGTGSLTRERRVAEGVVVRVRRGLRAGEDEARFGVGVAEGEDIFRLCERVNGGGGR